jgi:hypothetical protein
MSDDLSEFLLQGTHHARISPEMLELLGKQAANHYLDDKVPLNESVVKLASGYPDINQEQVKRICEFANNATYLAIHDKNKTAGAQSSYPQFDLADPARVIQEMSDGARPTVITPVDMAYSRQPEKVKTSSPAVEAALEELFTSKTPDYAATKESAVEDLIVLKDQLQGTQATFATAAESCEMSFKMASAELYELVKQHVLDGDSIADVVVALRSTGVDKEKVSQVLEPIVEKLLKDKVAKVEQLTQQMKDIQKVAHRVVDAENPMVTTFLSVVTSHRELIKAASALEEVEEQLDRTNAFIQEKYFARRVG